MSFLKKTAKGMADVIPGLGRFTFDADLGTIFIMSGTGVIGYRVAMSLLAAGHKKVKVGVWKGERQIGPGKDDNCFATNIANVLEEKGAEIVEFDFCNTDDYSKVLKGVKTVFCNVPHVANWNENFVVFLMKCREMKVEHFVKLSFMHSKKYIENVPFCAFHNTCDEFLQVSSKNSRISYTVLATSHMMSTPLLHQGDVLKKEHMYKTASYGMGVNYVSPNDVADAAMVVMLNLKDHRNKVYNLSGPKPVTDRKVAQYLSEVYGKQIKHVELGYHDYVKDIQTRGLPEWLIKDSAALEKMKASGVDEEVDSYYPDLEKLIGRPAESFQGYLNHQDSMRPGRSFP